jgi:hypothetical protein
MKMKVIYVTVPVQQFYSRFDGVLMVDSAMRALRTHSETNLWAPYLNSESEAVLFLQVRTAAVSEFEPESSESPSLVTVLESTGSVYYPRLPRLNVHRAPIITVVRCGKTLPNE